MPRLPAPKLTTERLILRAQRPEDAAALRRALAHPAVHRPLGAAPPRTQAEVRARIRRNDAERRRGARVAYVCVERDTRDLVGWCTLKEVNREQHMKGELAYWLARPYWGRGFMREALETFIPHVFATLDLHRLYAQVLATNRRSAALLERLGFQWEATIRQGHRRSPDGLRRDAYLYSLLATDPAARRLMREDGRR